MNKGRVLSELRRSLDLLHPCFDWPAERLAKAYAPGKWTARQVLVHLVDSELVFGARFRHIVAEPQVAVVPFDQDRWIKTLIPTQRNLRHSQKLFVGLRETLIELVDFLPEPLLAREGKHPEKPSYRAWDIANYAATHVLHHYGQLVAIQEGIPWVPRPDAPDPD
jgi:uncharacterized damage-inducible protein DinB